MTSLLTKIKSLDTKISTYTQNISNKQNLLTAGTNITIDSNNIISSSGGGSITQAQLDEKQPTLTSTSNITTGTISSGKITGKRPDESAREHVRFGGRSLTALRARP